jgi:hypothetical protein
MRAGLLRTGHGDPLSTFAICCAVLVCVTNSFAPLTRSLDPYSCLGCLCVVGWAVQVRIVLLKNSVRRVVLGKKGAGLDRTVCDERRLRARYIHAPVSTVHHIGREELWGVASPHSFSQSLEK